MWRLRGGGRKRVVKGNRRTEKGGGGWQEEEGEMSIDVEDDLLSQHSMLDALVRRWCVSLVLVCFIMYKVYKTFSKNV